MKKTKLFLFFITIIWLSGCAIHSGTYNSGVAITNNQFRVAGIAQGSANTTHFLGMGGLAVDALVYEAKQDLYNKYPLAKGMVLANVTVDVKNSLFLIFVQTKLVTISADIIDFNPQNLDFPYQGFYTDDSTFFPTKKLPTDIYIEKKFGANGKKIEKGSTVLFTLNNEIKQGVVLDINNYGVKCSYETNNKLRKIYLKAEYLTWIK